MRFALFLLFLTIPVHSEKPKVMMCTADAKMCPDGSAVSRTGPNCTFPTCPNSKPKETKVTENQINQCEYNSDCIVVLYRHCCGSTKKAINSKYQKLYLVRPKWQSYNGSDCAMMGRCQDDSNVTKAVCRQRDKTKHCVLVQ